MESLDGHDALISLRIRMLAAVFGKKITNDMIEVYQRVLRRFPIKVLSKAFRRAESDLEKLPTPKILGVMCGEAMPSTMWRYNFTRSQAPNPEGMLVDVLIDPDPSCDVCREPRSVHPSKRCPDFIDKFNAEVMYRPQDCAEGRAFLAKLKEVAGRM